MNLFDIQKEVKKRITNDRFNHTLGVQATGFSLALLYEADYNKAIYAGLLHDLAKCMDDEKLLSECKKYNLPISEIERTNPYLLHGKLGAYYAKTQFAIEDEEILNSIIYHTTGRPNMSLLEKIIFVADYIEPTRDEENNPNLERIRKLSFKNIDIALIEILKSTIDYLGNDKSKIDKLTIDTFNYYSKYYKKKRMEGNE